MMPQQLPSAAALLSKKPMARATRVGLFEREVRERLSLAALELLLERAEVLSEGQRSTSPTAAHAYFGSTMITIDVARLGHLFRDPCDARSAARVAELLQEDGRFTRMVQGLAAREAQRLAGGTVRVRPGELHVRSEGTFVYLDIDVEE